MALEEFVRGRRGAQALDEDVRAAALAGHAYVEHPDEARRAHFRDDFVYLSARHMVVRTEVGRLLSALAAHGIEALLFKGFYLAEFVYRTPAQRSYADVDLAVRPPDIDEAFRVAAELGWIVTWRIREGSKDSPGRAWEYAGHEAGQLRMPSRDVTIDLHRRLVHNSHRRMSPGIAQRRLTDTSWSESHNEVIDGAQVRVLRPEDSVVLGLVLNRCWGSDQWQVKPRDYLDLSVLARRFVLRREQIVERARQLGVERTVNIYLSRCDPFRERLDLARPSWWAIRWWNLRVTRERGPTDLQHLTLHIAAVPCELVETVRALWDVLHSRRLLRSRPLPMIVHRAPPQRALRQELDFRDWLRINRSIRRAARLIGASGADRDVLIALSLREALRRRGYNATLALPQGDEALIPHLLLDGKPLLMGGDSLTPGRRWPAP